MQIVSQPEILSQVLPLISDLNDFIRIDKVQRIAIKRVLAHLWHEGRMKDCLARLESGEKAPPIHVCGYILHDEAWYTVEDGNHRTLAAREAGKTQISAKVGGITVCKPKLYTIYDHILWKHLKDNIWSQIQTGLSEELEQALIQTGVKHVETRTD